MSQQNPKKKKRRDKNQVDGPEPQDTELSVANSRNTTNQKTASEMIEDAMVGLQSGPSGRIVNLLNNDGDVGGHDWSDTFTFKSNKAELTPNRTTQLQIVEEESRKLAKYKERLRMCPLSNHFYLQKHPNPFQRKCYANENRYLLPHPLVIVHSSTQSLQWWRVTALLGAKDGETLDKQSNGREYHYLVDPSGLKKMNRPMDISCEFSLRLLSQSALRRFTLIFYIKYMTETGGVYREKLISEPFELQSNKIFVGAEPQVETVTPWQGSHTSTTEVTIKGSDFSRKVSVHLDGREIPVIRFANTFVVVQIPPQPALQVTTTMQLLLINHFKKQKVPARSTQEFTYIV